MNSAGNLMNINEITVFVGNKKMRVFFFIVNHNIIPFFNWRRFRENHNENIRTS